MSLKKVRGGVTGTGDTLVSKTCLFFFRVSPKGRRGGGSLYLVIIFEKSIHKQYLRSAHNFLILPGFYSLVSSSQVQFDLTPSLKSS